MLGPYLDELSEAKSTLISRWRLAQLARSVLDDVRTAGSANPRCGAELLAVLAQDPEPRVCRLTACSPNCPAGALAQLAEHPHSVVRKAVAENSNCPQGVLEILSRDSERWVREAVAANSHTSGAILENLAYDFDRWVREVAAKNRCTPPEIAEAAEALAHDSDSVVSGAAKWVIHGPLVGAEASDSVEEGWEEVVAPYGRGVEEVAWSVVCGGFEGAREDVVAVAVGGLAQVGGHCRGGLEALGRKELVVRLG